MGDKWKEMKFGDCADLVRDTCQPEESFDKPYIGLEHIEQGTLRLNSTGIAEDVTSTKSNFKNGDILFGKLRPYFRKVVRPKFEGICSTDIWVVRAKDGIDQGFLFYWMASKEFVDIANQGSEGTKMPRAKWDFVTKIKQEIPSLPEQKAIAHILGTLDDKIELNRKMNETLEAMARAIFKSWFVDFDPIPGLGPHKEWHDSPLGKIPKGWRVGTLGDLVDFVNERVEAKPEKDNEKYIALDDMPHRSFNISQFRSGAEVNSSIIRFKEGDILFGAMRPYFHKVGLAQFDGITRTTTFVLRPKQPHMCLFALMNFFSDSVIEYATNASVGSTIPYIKWDALVSYQILMPTEDLIAKFNDFVMPMIQQIKINAIQSLTLASIRDALLPKLLSGEIRVKDAERFAEEIV